MDFVYGFVIGAVGIAIIATFAINHLHKFYEKRIEKLQQDWLNII